jgi:hypothetical protein
VKDFYGRDLFDEDLGTGLPNNSSLNCLLRTGAPFGSVTLNCTLILGSKVSLTAAKVQITGDWDNLSANTFYTIEIDPIVNPNIIGDDFHVYTVLTSYTSTNAIINEGYCYDFSFKTVAITTLPIYPAPSPTTNVISDLGVIYTISFTPKVTLR